MAELFIEIFCEEIPARMQRRAGEDLTKAIADGLSKAGLTMEAAHCYTGPRRLVFTADIPLRSPDISEERKGPRLGSPDKALEGFMKAAGLTDISQAQIRSDPKKGEFYVAVIEKTGVPSAEILAQLIPDIMHNFPWPKSMKSGASHFRWVRPLTSMICLLDSKIVDFEVGGIKTSNVTQGHRRHGAGPFTVKDFADYRATLQSHGHVMICTCERKDKILTDARAACAAKGLELVEDEGLLNEVAGLTEWPVVILGDMDARFLELPDEVIRLTLKSHQKTFTVRDPKTGSLAPHYIIVANQIAPDGGAAIKAGNGKVIAARLSDAQFFAAEDAKLKLIDYYDKLGTVVFHEKLGSIRDKAERVAALARELAPKVGADPEKTEQAARLAKCDLVTQTVVEFTSLQGQIGAQMYRAEHAQGRETPAQGGGQGMTNSASSTSVSPPTVPSTSVPPPIVPGLDPGSPASKNAANQTPAQGGGQGKLKNSASSTTVSPPTVPGLDPGSPASKNATAQTPAQGGGQKDDGQASGQSAQFDEGIALAIEQHYKPAGPSDAVPTNPVAVAVALADKLDTLVGFWAIDEKPTGSKDPYALRRAALGVVRIVLENGVRLDFQGMIFVYAFPLVITTVVKAESGRRADEVTKVWNTDSISKASLKKIVEEEKSYVSMVLDKTTSDEGVSGVLKIVRNLLTFILDRLKVYLRDQGMRHDIIDAAMTGDEDDLVSIVNRVKALQDFITTPEGENLLAGYKRAANILKSEVKKSELPTGAPTRPEDAHGAALYDALQIASTEIETALAGEDYSAAMQGLAQLRAPIDAFFTHVQVISDDTAVKENNLRLLLNIRDTARQIADFEAIQG